MLQESASSDKRQDHQAPSASATEPRAFRISGMDCPSCATTIQAGVARLPDVTSSQLDYGAARLEVEGPAETEAVLARVRALGYEAWLEGAQDGGAFGDAPGSRPSGRPAGSPFDPDARDGGFWTYLISRPEPRLAAIAIPLLLPGLILGELTGREAPFWAAAMSLAAAALTAGPVIRGAYRALRYARRIDMNVLMTVAGFGAVAIGAWVEAGMLMVLFALGEALEGFTAERARRAVQSLLSAVPREATRLRRAGESAAASTSVGDALDSRASGSTPGAPLPNPAASLSISLFDERPAPSPALEAELRAAQAAADAGSLDASAAACKRGTPGSEIVDIDQLEAGDVILVFPGGRVPTDGRILAGASAIDESALTGEPLPVERSEGETLRSGSINGEGALEVEVLRPAAESTLAQIMRLVEAAQARQAPSQRIIDRFAAIYTPAVAGLALLAISLPPLLFGQPFLDPAEGGHGWLYRGLALLVVACPCALVIGTPVATISAIANGARNGVLFKSGAVLEGLAGVKALAFDKTGTLTLGQPTVVSLHSLGCENGGHAGAGLASETAPGAPSLQRDAIGLEAIGMGALGVEALEGCSSCDDLLGLAGAIEARSQHPAARAVLAEVERRGLGGRFAAADSVESLTGLGLRGAVGGRPVTIASHRYFDLRPPPPAHPCPAADRAAAAGHSPLLVSLEERYLGRITIADRVRPNSRAVLSRLRDLGLETQIMLTGDHRPGAERVAEAVGMANASVRADLMPAEKLSAIEELRQAVGPVAMVGDGMNDAPALVAADVGIAVAGALGTEQAMESADITLMSGDLQQLPFAFRLARAARLAVIANVALALGIKLAFMILMLAGMGSMWMAVLADVGTTVLVTLLGMRLLGRPRPEPAL